MKLNEKIKNVEFNLNQVSKFKINASPKAFQILSSNLYSNPIGAVVRELSTNAYDAHKMVGKENEPFEITLPTHLNMNFKIRDFGPGLTEEEINTIYTTFFESTKIDSNDFVGCLGLGSKTPFAISDVFTINSYKDGKKLIFSAFLDESHIPNISKIAEIDTDEENGLEIIVPVDEKIIFRFETEVQEQLKYFKVKPKVTNKNIKWKEVEYLKKNERWGIKKEGELNIIQGQIAYPIKKTDLFKYFQEYEIIERMYSIDFFVEIGEVNIAPSRETLYFDKRTIEKIKELFEDFEKNIYSEIQKEIDEQKTYYDAVFCFEQMVRKFHFLERSKINNFTYRGMALKKIEIDKDLFDEYFALYISKRKNGTFTLRKHDVNLYYIDKAQIYLTPNPYFYIKSDDERKIETKIKKIKEYVRELYSKNKLDAENYSSLAFVIISKVEFEKIKELLRGKEIINADDIKIQKKKNTKKSSKKTDDYIYLFNKRYFYLKEAMKPILVKEETIKDGYFCFIKNKKIIFRGKEISVEVFHDIINEFEFLKESNIYFISETKYKKYKEFFDEKLKFIEDELNEYIGKIKNKMVFYAKNQLGFEDIILYNKKTYIDFLKSLKNKEKVQRLIELLENNKFISKFDWTAMKIYERILDDISEFEKNNYILEEIKKELKKYPLLEVALTNNKFYLSELKEEFEKYFQIMV